MRNQQRGYALFIVMLLITIASIIVLMISREKTKRDANIKAIAWSNALRQVCSAADTYSTRNWSTVSAAASTQIAISALKGIPPLTSDTLVTLRGVTLHASVTMSPTGCDPSAFACKGDVRVWTEPLPGTVADRQALGNAIVRRIGDLAGISLPTNPSVFLSRKNARSDTNPTGLAGAVLVRCGEVNVSTSEAGVRGNTAMTATLDAGGYDMTFPNAGTSVARITETAGSSCSDVNRFAMDSTGRYMYCDGNTWKTTAKQVTEETTTVTYEYTN
jgi:hypothetical protein